MLREILYKNTSIPMLKNGLDAFAERHRAIASNISHSETPGYKTKKVAFEKQLINAIGDRSKGLSSTHSSHIPGKKDPHEVYPVLYEIDSDKASTGINNVNIEQEIADMATNQIQYQLTARKVQGYFGKIRKIAKGGL